MNKPAIKNEKQSKAAKILRNVKVRTGVKAGTCRTCGLVQSLS